MSIAYIVTLCSNAGLEEAAPPTDTLPIYRFAIQDPARAKLMGRACVSALRQQHAGLKFSYDVRMIQFVGQDMQTFELVADVLDL